MTNDGKVRIGVIGAGSWAISNHIPILAAREDVELVSAVRKGREALEAIQETFGFDHISEDYRDALAQDLDAVVVASPSSLHHEHAKAALEAGLNVLCEKPFTTDPADAWDLHRTAEATGRHLLISFGWNYGHLGMEAKRIVDERGGVGEVEHMMVSMASGTRELLRSTDGGGYEGSAEGFAPEAETWTDPALSGGGYAPAQLSHAMGLAMWLTGDRASEVFAFMNNVDAKVDMHDAISLRFSSGATGSLSGASCPGPANAIDAPDEPWPRHQLLIRIYGSEGQLILDLERDFLWHYRMDGVDEKVDLPPGAGLYLCDGPPNTLVDLTLGRDVPNLSPADLGARTVEVVAGAEKSARTGAVVTVAPGA